MASSDFLIKCTNECFLNKFLKKSYIIKSIKPLFSNKDEPELEAVYRLKNSKI